MNVSRPNDAAHAPVRRWSLRNRLIVLLLMATAGLWSLASWSVYQEAQIESRELFDDSLRETAYLLLTVVKHEMDEHGPAYTAQMIDAADVPDSHYLQFQIWDLSGQLIYRSQDAPLQPWMSVSASGYSYSGVGADSVRLFVAWNADRTLQIQVAEPLSHRRTVSNNTLWRLLWFAAFFLPVTFFLIWWIVARSFAPVQWTSESVAQRTGRHLSDVELGNVPREIAPLIEALNRLLARIRETLDYERRFTADAAHELRTPLAAVRAHAQVLQGARTPEEAHEAVSDIITGVDRSRRLVDQLLALARLDQSGHAAAAAQAVDLAELVNLQVMDHQYLAERAGVHLYEEVVPVVITGHADQMHILLRNLIDNALRYTPSGGEVRVSCGTDARGVFLAVHDSGHGIPEAERQRIFERFYRINRVETSHTFGSGLGLSIVQRLAEKHAARIEIEAGLNGKGVGFVVRFARKCDAGA